jgi:hypothetical protein
MRLMEMTVSPVNCQVVLLVPDAEEDPPEWPTGRELVVANSGAIYVATQCDVDGDVRIEVWMGQEIPGEDREPIYDGTLRVRDAGALVGSFTGDHLGLLSLLREGAHRVRVYTDPPGPHAERVSFVID